MGDRRATLRQYWWGSCALTTIVIAGCTTAPTRDAGIPPSKPISASGGLKLAAPIVTFFDSDSFDTELGQTFADRPRVVRVPFVAPTSPNALPPRINVWLTEVKKGDGTIRLAAADPAARPDSYGVRGLGVGLTFDIIDAIVTPRERRQRASELDGAHHYDATIIYDKNTGAATAILFERRGA
jgi:hypothetical protein